MNCETLLCMHVPLRERDRETERQRETEDRETERQRDTES